MFLVQELDEGFFGNVKQGGLVMFTSLIVALWLPPLRLAVVVVFVVVDAVVVRLRFGSCWCDFLARHRFL